MAYATTSMSLTHRWHSHTHTSPRARLISFCLSACERACAMAPRGRLLEYVHVCVCVYVCEWVSECVCLCAVGRGAKSSSPFGLIVAPPSFPSPWISSFSLSFSCFNFTLLLLSFSTFLRIASSLSLLSSLSLSLSLSGGEFYTTLPPLCELHWASFWCLCRQRFLSSISGHTSKQMGYI